jgi:uncharacterized ion transporter superfamily protein YfcC
MSGQTGLREAGRMTEAPTPAHARAPEPPSARGTFKFPTAFTVLAAVLVLVWIASFFVPPGAYKKDAAGSPTPGTYAELPSCSAAAATAPALNADSPAESGQAPADALAAPGATISDLGIPCADKSFTFRFKQLWNAPPNGLYGVENSQGFVGASEEGFLYGSAAIFFFVLAVGAFITVTMKTEAIQTGSAGWRCASGTAAPSSSPVDGRVRTGRDVVRHVGGDARLLRLLVPLALALGYDRLVAASIIFLGAGTGVIGSTVNPFATGVASDAAGISIGEGIGLRIALWVVLLALAIGYVLWYAKRVRTNPAKSIVGLLADRCGRCREPRRGRPAAHGRQKLVLVLFAGTFLLMIYGFIPWNDLWQEGFGSNFPLPTFHDFYFPEAAALFLVMSVVVGVIAGLGEEGTVSTITAGAADFLTAGLIVVFARGITVVMKNAHMTDTILHWMENAVSGRRAALRDPRVHRQPADRFLVPSSSGHAALVMPILAPLADFAGVSRSIVVTAYQSASGLVNLVTPTSAVIMGGLALSKVGYDRYLKFVWPFLIVVFVVVCAFIGIAAATS